MSLNFGNNLFDSRSEFLSNIDFIDIVKGQSYVSYYGLTTASGQAAAALEYATGDDAQVTIDSQTDRAAQTFTVGSENLYVSLVQLKLQSDMLNYLGGNITLEIQETTGGEPNGIILDTAQPTEGVTNGPAAAYDFPFSGTALEAAGVYAIVLRGDGVGDELYWRYDGSSPTFTGGSYGASANSGTTWGMDTSKDFIFGISGTNENPYALIPISGLTSNDATTVRAVTIGTIDDVGLDVNFDYEIQNTTVLVGDVIVEITDTIATITGYLNLTLYKVNGITETSLATVELGTGTGAQVGKMNIPKQIIIKKGESLRFNVQIKGAETGIGTFTLSHSGSNLKVYVPYKIIT